jgi:hypothetical protein
MIGQLPQPGERYDYQNEAQSRRILNEAIRFLTPQFGTYVPTIASSGGGETVGYGTQLGVWARIGVLMWFSADIRLSSVSGGSGQLRVTLPVLAGDIGMAQAASAVIDNMAAGWTGAPMADITPTLGYAVVSELETGNPANAWASLTSTSEIRLTGSYLVST